jgi:hypothetical protein
MVPGMQATLYAGDVTLQVVGESHYQDALWALVGGLSREHRNHDITAILVAETDNPYDADAISVWIDGQKVGYLSRDDAARYRPGLLALERRSQIPVALEGVIAGGGERDDGLGKLGVFLRHDPTDFGLPGPRPARSQSRRPRTGRSEVDAGVAWLTHLSPNDSVAIKELRRLLASTADPIDRHFMYAELVHRLYRCRDTFSSALQEFDEACAQHDAEMPSLRAALITELGGVPLLETYKQMCVRQQKAHDWERVIDWANRGIMVYGANAIDEAFINDLRSRLKTAQAKLAPPASRTTRSRSTAPPSHHDDSSPEVEILVCRDCGSTFERVVLRGRKPTLCPNCRLSPLPRPSGPEDQPDVNVPPPGWYPDVSARHELRYWDGDAWTDHVADAGTTATEPLASPPTP